jgi:hypothetical protein
MLISYFVDFISIIIFKIIGTILKYKLFDLIGKCLLVSYVFWIYKIYVWMYKKKFMRLGKIKRYIYFRMRADIAV